MKLRSVAENTKLILLIALSVLPLIPSTAFGTTKEQWNAAVATVEVLSAQKNVKTGMPQRALVIISKALSKSLLQNPFDERPTFVGLVKDKGLLQANDFTHPDSSVEQASNESEGNSPSKLPPTEYAEQILRHLMAQPMFADHEVLQTMLESLGTAPQKAGTTPKAPCITSGTVPVIDSKVMALVRVGKPAPDAGDSKRFPSDAKNEIVAVLQALRGPRESKRVSLLNEDDLPGELVGHSLTFANLPSLANFAQTSKPGQAWFQRAAPYIEAATIKDSQSLQKLMALQNSHLRVFTQNGFFNVNLDDICTKFKDLRELRLQGCTSNLDTAAISKLSGLQHLTMAQCYKPLKFILNSKTLPELKSVNLSYGSFGNDAIRQLKGLALQELDISRTQVSDDGLKELDVSSLSGMTTLDLSHLRGITNQSVEFLNQLPALRHLSLRGTRVTDEGLRALDSKILSQLRTLDLSGLPGVTDASIPKINEFTELTRLGLLDDSFLTDKNHKRDHFYNYERHVETQITNEAFRRLDSKKLRKLEEITLTEDAIGIDKLNEFPNLRVIVLKRASDGELLALDPDRLRMLESLSWKRLRTSPDHEHLLDVTDRSMLVLERFHRLKKLDLSESQVTDQGLALLRPEHHKALEELDVSGCQGITDASVPLILKFKEQGLKKVRSIRSGISFLGLETIQSAGIELDGVANGPSEQDLTG